MNIVINPQKIGVSISEPAMDMDTGTPVARRVIEPYINIVETDEGAVITCTDPDGTTSATIYNGEKGDPGEQGIPGKDGKDGQDGLPGKDGADGLPGKDGKDGQDGKDGSDGSDGFSPVVSVEAITGGHSISVTDASGTQTFSVMDGEDGSPGTPGSPGKPGEGVPTGGVAGQILSKRSWTDYDTEWGMHMIPYAQVDNTSTSTKFTATVPGITALKHGVSMMLKNGVVTSASGFTINVNGLGAKPSYSNMSAASADTTLFNINYTMLFVYDETRIEGGCWVCYRGYNSDTNTIGYQIRTNSSSLPVTGACYRYRLLFTAPDGMGYVPANTSTSTNGTAKRTVNQDKIDPFGDIFYYGTTTAVSSGSRPAATSLYYAYALVLGYSFNVNGNETITAWKPCYLKCEPQSDGSAIMDATTPIVQALPSTNDGKIYIFLGVAYDTTHMELHLNHPVYYHDGTHVRRWNG